MKCFYLLLFLCFTSFSQGQVLLTGKVYDKSTGESIPGANILITGTSKGTITDNAGNFQLKSETPIDTIRVTFVGYSTQFIHPVSSHIEVALEPEAISMCEVVISASRDYQLRNEAPIAISTISPTTINDTKAVGLEQLINKSPGVFMVDLGNEQHSMSIRQPLSYRSLFLYLEDGIPIRTTGDFNHNALIEINQSSISRIEIIKGPASSLYGSEAVGGAINFITRSPSLKPTGKAQIEIGSFGYKRTDFFVSSTHKKTGFFIGGYIADRDQQDSVHNDFTKFALNFRVDHQFSSRTKLITSFAFIDYKTDMKGGIDSVRFYNQDYISLHRFTYRDVETFRARTTLEHEWSENHHSRVTFFYRNVAIGQNPHYSIKSVTDDPTKARGEINKDQFQSLGTIIQHVQKIKFLQGKLITGLSFDFSPATYYAKFISINKNSNGIYTDYTPTDSLLTDYNVDLYNSAAYLQFEINPLKKLKFVGTVRYDRLDYQFDNHLPPSAFTGAPDENNKFEKFTPKVGFTYDFGNGKGLYTNYSVGFSPPNISELYRGVKVPVLKPATYNNYEIGGWFCFREKTYIEMSAYKMDGTNEIVSVKLTDGSTENQNAGRTSHIGIEGIIKYAFSEQFIVRFGGTIAQHKYVEYIEKGNNYSGNLMSQAPAHLINSEMIFKPLFIKGFRISVEWQKVGKYFMDAKNTQEYEGFNIFNVRTGYRWKSIEAWINCTNITNAIYATTVEKSSFGTSYRPGQLRTFNVGLCYNFERKK